MKIKKIILVIIGILFIFRRCEEIDLDADLDSLKRINNDIVGVINIGTMKDVIVQSKDNEYYMNHNRLKYNSYEGSVFLDYRVSINSKIILVYGHNSKLVDTSFSYLENYLDKDFYEDNNVIEIRFEDRINKYLVFSVFLEDSNFSYLNINISDYKRHYEYLKDKSMYDVKIDFDGNEEVLILQTCSYQLKNGYIVIVGKLI